MDLTHYYQTTYAVFKGRLITRLIQKLIELKKLNFHNLA